MYDIEPELNSKILKNKRGKEVANVFVVPKGDMEKLEILLRTKEKDYTFKNPKEFSEFLRKKSEIFSFSETTKAIRFVSSKFRPITKNKESASVRIGGIGSSASSEKEV